MSKATISTPNYLLDQAKRRLTPSINNFPGMAALEKRLLNTNWTPRKLADPPPGSGISCGLKHITRPVARSPSTLIWAFAFECCVFGNIGIAFFRNAIV